MRAWLAACLVLSASLARADDDAPPPRRTPFDRGRFAVSLGGGTQTALGAHYYVVGAGIGYYVLDGLGINLSGLVELGGTPFIAKVSPELRYVAQPLVGKWPVIPYVGAFYNHWFVGGNYADVDTIGARAGLLYLSGALILGIGAAYEHTVSACTMDCDQVYPDFTISFAL
jgi:hypothetical protein